MHGQAPQNADFGHVTTWVFDLDNTLYPASIRLFDQIEERMRRFVSHYLAVSLAEADRLRALYWAEYGTTLAGLMARHDMPPDGFLDYVHDIDFSVLPPAAGLTAQIAALRGRKIVYTNGTRPYANKVLVARGLADQFEAVFGIEHAGFHPKPARAAFERVFDLAQIDPIRAAMFEDEPRNLNVPKSLGMATILIAPPGTACAHADMIVPRLEDALSQMSLPVPMDGLGERP